MRTISLILPRASECLFRVLSVRPRTRRRCRIPAAAKLILEPKSNEKRSGDSTSHPSESSNCSAVRTRSRLAASTV